MSDTETAKNAPGAPPATPESIPFARLTPAEAASSKARRDARRLAIKQQNATSKI